MPYISEDGIKHLQTIADKCFGEAQAYASMALIETENRKMFCYDCGGELVLGNEDGEIITCGCPILGHNKYVHVYITDPDARGIRMREKTRREIWPEEAITAEDIRDYHETERAERRRE